MLNLTMQQIIKFDYKIFTADIFSNKLALQIVFGNELLTKVSLRKAVVTEKQRIVYVKNYKNERDITYV